MPELFEDWLVELAKTENYSALDKLPEYLSGQYAKAGNAIAERNRLASYFQNYGPHSPFSGLVLEAILSSA